MDLRRSIRVAVDWRSTRIRIRTGALLFLVLDLVFGWYWSPSTRGTRPLNTTWHLSPDECGDLEISNPHDRFVLILVGALFIVAVVYAAMDHDRIAGTLLAVVAAITGFALSLQSLSWQEYRLLNGYPGEMCSQAWPSLEYFLRDADWLAAGQTQSLSVVFVLGFVIVAATAEGLPARGHWRRTTFKGKWLARTIWIPMMSMAAILAIIPLTGARNDLAKAPWRTIPYSLTVSALLLLGLTAMLPYRRCRALGMAALGSGLAIAFAQFVALASFSESHQDRQVIYRPGEYDLEYQTRLSNFQVAALDRIESFYLASCISALLIFGLVILSRYLLGGTLYERRRSQSETAF